MFGVLWELFQQNRLDRASHDAARARFDAGKVRDEHRERADEHEKRLDRLELVCEALQSLLRERAGISDAMVEARMREIDAEDGRLDGRISAATEACGRCGRVRSARRGWCVYCGREAPG